MKVTMCSCRLRSGKRFFVRIYQEVQQHFFCFVLTASFSPFETLQLSIEASFEDVFESFFNTGKPELAEESGNPPIAVTGIKLDKATASVAVGTTTTLNVTFLPASASMQSWTAAGASWR